MIHSACELRHVSSAVGYGVVATRFIPKGSITWVLDDLDQVFDSDEIPDFHPILREALDKYSYANGKGQRVLCWDHSRFINHSCNATSLAPGLNLEIAVRNIQAGEQITDDYGLLNLDSEFRCACGLEQCRGMVGPNDFERYADHWDALLADALPHLNMVEQPLWDLVREKSEIRKALAGEAPLPSCRYHLFKNLRLTVPGAA